MSMVGMSTTMVPLLNKIGTGAQVSIARKEWQWRKKNKTIAIRNKMVAKPPTYSSCISNDIMIPIHESPLASLDHYLDDKPRVFKAIFPEKGKSQRLNEDDWRIQMLPIEFPMLTAWPIVDMRVTYKSGGVDYPPGVPIHITKVLELDIIKWDMQGLDKILKASDFSLGVKGTFYPDRHGPRIWLKGQFQMSVSFVFPRVLALIPENLRQDVADSILEGLMVNMKHRINKSLLADYNLFKRDKLKDIA